MSERPTLETDDILNTIRKLECELAEAVKARDHNRTCVKRLTQERDEARELARELMNELAWKGKLVGLSLSQQKVITKAKEVLG
jgi:hypothetical protein